MSRKFEEKILESLESCIIGGKDSDACLDEVMKENNIDQSQRDDLKKEVLNYSKGQ